MNYLYCLYLNYLDKLNIPEIVAFITFPIIPFVFIATALVLIVLTLILAERKILAIFTQRKGPNRVGFCGFLQTVADAVKIICKENIYIHGSDRFLFNISPLIVFVPIMVVWGLIPYSAEFEFMSFSVSAILFMAILLVPVLGVLFSGYASNNKFSLLGALRSVTQIISYELPMTFVLLSIAVLASSLNLKDIVYAQVSIFPFCGWFIFPCLLGFIIMFICGLAELNRCPFDLPEAESELVCGYNTEYSGMRFALFYLGEYALLFVFSAFIATIFLGGFLPLFGFYVSEKLFSDFAHLQILIYIEQVIWLLLKTFFIIFLIIWVRATLPRLNASALMGFSWKFLFPLSILNFIYICGYKYFVSFGGF